jgi:hypothetical protein
MASGQRDEFERRVLALVRDQLDHMDENNPDGYEFGDFVITCRYWAAPEPGSTLHPWDGGPYPGWWVNAWTRGSSRSYWLDAELLQDALESVQQRADEAQREWDDQGRAADDETDNGEDEGTEGD